MKQIMEIRESFTGKQKTRDLKKKMLREEHWWREREREVRKLDIEGMSTSEELLSNDDNTD